MVLAQGFYRKFIKTSKIKCNIVSMGFALLQPDSFDYNSDSMGPIQLRFSDIYMVMLTTESKKMAFSFSLEFFIVESNSFNDYFCSTESIQKWFLTRHKVLSIAQSFKKNH